MQDVHAPGDSRRGAGLRWGGGAEQQQSAVTAAAAQERPNGACALFLVHQISATH